MDILGVRIDNLSKKEILEKMEFFLSEDKPNTILDKKVFGKFHQIATVNPEFILKAQDDIEFKNILNNCDLNIADGVGIWYAFIRNFGFLKKRMAGVDLLKDILSIANNKKLNVYLAINKDGLSKYEEIKESLLKKYPNLCINGIDMDIESHRSSACLPDRQIISHQGLEINDDRLLMTNCQILISNFGAPHQEKFLNAQKNGTIRLAMGVGGSFDFMTGKVKRAPKVMRFFGLEWLFRLFKQPRYRFKRILNAVIIFPFKVLINK